MNRKLMYVIASTLVSSLLFSAYQPSAATPYYNHDGSVDEGLEKILVKKLQRGDNNYWYRVQVCAENYPIKITQMVFKSDIDKVTQGINKMVPKGECKSYGATMKANDPNTLGAEMIEVYEAVEKMQQLLKDMPTMSKNDRKVAHHQFIELFVATGIMPR